MNTFINLRIKNGFTKSLLYFSTAANKYNSKKRVAKSLPYFATLSLLGCNQTPYNMKNQERLYPESIVGSQSIDDTQSIDSTDINLERILDENIKDTDEEIKNTEQEAKDNHNAPCPWSFKGTWANFYVSMKTNDVTPLISKATSIATSSMNLVATSAVNNSILAPAASVITTCLSPYVTPIVEPVVPAIVAYAASYINPMVEQMNQYLTKRQHMTSGQIVNTIEEITDDDFVKDCVMVDPDDSTDLEFPDLVLAKAESNDTGSDSSS